MFKILKKYGDKKASATVIILKTKNNISIFVIYDMCIVHLSLERICFLMAKVWMGKCRLDINMIRYTGKVNIRGKTTVVIVTAIPLKPYALIIKEAVNPVAKPLKPMSKTLIGSNIKKDDAMQRSRVYLKFSLIPFFRTATKPLPSLRVASMYFAISADISPFARKATYIPKKRDDSHIEIIIRKMV